MSFPWLYHCPTDKPRIYPSRHIRELPGCDSYLSREQHNEDSLLRSVIMVIEANIQHKPACHDYWRRTQQKDSIRSFKAAASMREESRRPTHCWASHTGRSSNRLARSWTVPEMFLQCICHTLHDFVPVSPVPLTEQANRGIPERSFSF